MQCASACDDDLFVKIVTEGEITSCLVKGCNALLDRACTFGQRIQVRIPPHLQRMTANGVQLVAYDHCLVIHQVEVHMLYVLDCSIEAVVANDLVAILVDKEEIVFRCVPINLTPADGALVEPLIHMLHAYDLHRREES